MVWVRIDENFAQHPKVVQAGPLGMAMQVAALCYCNRHMTDGFVPKQIAKQLLDLDGLGMRMWDGELVGGGYDADWSMIVEDLVAAGLWVAVNGGWTIHDFLEYQPSRQQIQEVSEKRRLAGQAGGVAKARQSAKQSAKQTVGKSSGKTASKTEAKSCPVPVPVTNSNPPISPPGGGTAERGSRIASDWQPDEQDRAYATERDWSAGQIDAEAEKFRDHWLAKAGKAGVKLDWPATWRTWVRNAEGYGLVPAKRQSTGNGADPDRRLKDIAWKIKRNAGAQTATRDEIEACIKAGYLTPDEAGDFEIPSEYRRTA